MSKYCVFFFEKSVCVSRSREGGGRGEGIDLAWRWNRRGRRRRWIYNTLRSPEITGGMRAWWISFLFGECEFPDGGHAILDQAARISGSCSSARARVRAPWEKPETPEARDTEGTREEGPHQLWFFLERSRDWWVPAIQYARSKCEIPRIRGKIIPFFQRIEVIWSLDLIGRRWIFWILEYEDFVERFLERIFARKNYGFMDLQGLSNILFLWMRREEWYLGSV